MNINGDFTVKEKETAFRVSVVGEKNTVRIQKSILNKLNLNEDPETLAIVLAVIEFARIDEKALGRSRCNLIKNPDVLERIHYLCEYEMNADMLIQKLSQMKYFEMESYLLEGKEEYFEEKGECEDD